MTTAAEEENKKTKERIIQLASQLPEDDEYISVVELALIAVTNRKQTPKKPAQIVAPDQRQALYDLRRTAEYLIGLLNEADLRRVVIFARALLDEEARIKKDNPRAYARQTG